MTPFQCSRCGACCRLVGRVHATAHLDRGDGVCRHLRGEPGGEHACAIYDTRPAECRIDESTPVVMQLAEWQQRNADACKVLRLAVYGGG